MPNRILKESICTSDTIESLSLEAENFLYRLLVTVDDFGRMDARPAILIGRCYPLRAGRVTDKDVQEWLGELEVAELITIYLSDGKPYLQIVTWDKHQHRRAQHSKYPSPDNGVIASASICTQVQARESRFTRGVEESRNRGIENRDSSSRLDAATQQEAVEPAIEPTPTASEDAIRLCEVLRGLIVTNDPKSPAGKLSAKQSGNWITDMDRLIRLDGRDPTEVERVIRWCQADNFWRSNILSAKKLREKYSQLLLKMREARPPGNNGHKRAPVPVAAKPETPMERSMRVYGIWPPPVDAEDSDTGPPDNHKPHYEKPPVPHARASPEERELYDQRLALWRNKQPWYDT